MLRIASFAGALALATIGLGSDALAQAVSKICVSPVGDTTGNCVPVDANHPFPTSGSGGGGGGGGSTSAFQPAAQTPLTATTASSSSPIGVGPTVLITNNGTTTAYINFGSATVTATTSSYPINAGQTIAFSSGGAGYIAAVTGTGSDPLSITTGTGLPAVANSGGTSGGGGGSGGAITSPLGPTLKSGSVSTTFATDFLGQTTMSGSVPVTIASNQSPIPTTQTAPVADQRQQNLTLAAGTVGNNLVIPLGSGGYGTLGLVLPGLAASGATVSFSVSKDGGTNYDAIGSFNAAAGTASSTRSGTDAGTSFGIGAETHFKITVTTAGTGNITVSYSASAAATRIANISPLVGQTTTGKDIGGVEQFGAWTVGIGGTLPAFAATPTFNLGTLNGAATAAKQPALGTAGAASTDVITVQGIAGGVAQPVSGTVTLGAGSAAIGSITNTSFASTQSGTWNVGLNAGTNIVGKFGIDQTTPGTTDSVTVKNTAFGANQGTAASAAGAWPVYNTIGGAALSTANPLPSFLVQGTSAVGLTNPQASSEVGTSAAGAGITPVVTAAGTSAVGKASQGNLYSAYASNQSTTTAYLACINATAAPTSGTAITPLDVATLPGSIGGTATINYQGGPPASYSTGVVCLVTTSLSTYTPGGNAFMNVRVR